MYHCVIGWHDVAQQANSVLNDWKPDMIKNIVEKEKI